MRGALALVGDCRALPLPDGSVDAVVTDPPYGLAFMGKSWDHDVPGPDYWREVYRVMKPGAHLLAFGGTRTWHWLTVGIEEAGFEVRDCLSWMYGTGFPKSYDVAQSIEKKVRTGKSRRPDRDLGGMSRDRFSGDHPDEDGMVADTGGKVELTAPEAQAWEGQGTNLKPAWEPIVLAMKPTDGTFAENALTHGVAGLNVDGCRIAAEQVGEKRENTRREDREHWRITGGSKGDGATTQKGRWPANVTLSHTRWCRRVGTKRVESDGHYPEERGQGNLVEGHGGQDGLPESYTEGEEVEDWDCPPSCPVRMLDEQSGERPSGSRLTGDEPRSEGFSGEVYGDGMRPRSWEPYRDTGGASRFYYCAKASRSEREAGLDRFEAKVSPSGGHGNEEDDPVSKRLGSQRKRVNTHPTVKPIDLCRWLVRLVTRKGHLVLDPFMGSGSIGCAALIERRRYIGLDLNPEYVEIARARLKHWTPKQVDLFRDAQEGAA